MPPVPPLSVAGLLPAHGLGGAQDLPLPLGLAVSAAVAALVVSFVVLALAWRTPRYAADGPGRPAPRLLQRLVDRPAYAWTVRLLGLAFFGYLVVPLVWGPDLVTNPVLGTFYVLVWVGIVPFSLLLGPVARAVSPVRTAYLLLTHLARTGTDGVVRYPAALGYWPAALGLFAFVWQELVDPQSAYVSTVRLWLVGYVAVMLVGAALFGEVWLARADPFEVYSTLVSRLSPWGRHEGRLVLRSPLAQLATTPVRPGLLAVLAVLFGSTAFDTFKDTLPWIRLRERLFLPLELTDTLALVSFCALVALTFAVAAMSTGTDPDAPGAVPRRALPNLLVPSVVPIVVGYMVAHYLTYFVEQGQATLIQLSDPLVRGDNLLGTADWDLSYWLSFRPTLLAVVKVLAVVLGHVVGVVAAHDRAVRLLPARHAVSGQLGMLVVMVAYTATGLYLLMGGF